MFHLSFFTIMQLRTVPHGCTLGGLARQVGGGSARHFPRGSSGRWLLIVLPMRTKLTAGRRVCAASISVRGRVAPILLKLRRAAISALIPMPPLAGVKYLAKLFLNVERWLKKDEIFKTW